MKYLFAVKLLNKIIILKNFCRALEKQYLIHWSLIIFCQNGLTDSGMTQIPQELLNTLCIFTKGRGCNIKAHNYFLLDFLGAFHCFIPLNGTPGFHEITKKCCYHKFVSAQVLTQYLQNNLEFRSEYRLE